MLYKSTRSTSAAAYSSAEVIKKGLADDGGLYVPENIPHISKADIDEISSMPYHICAAKILSLFLTDYSYDELLEDCRSAYSPESFRGGVAPLAALSDDCPIRPLELWHGPTAAFKDMALQIMPRLLSRALVKTNEKRTAYILVATSGDTGKAALEGYRDVPQTKITVFYPENGVSRVQKLQMATQTGENVDVCAIKGNFDDAQNGVKQIFGDKSTADVLDKKGYFFSSANSINWGRLAPQIVYYVYSYCSLVKERKIKNGDLVNVCVPTGNFGNILAAYIAKKAGLPIDKLICASNSNNVLTDFLNAGVYDRNRAFHLTMSPSMDILISSNLERLLYFAAGPEKTSMYMNELKETGKYNVDENVLNEIKNDFKGYFATEKETSETIRRTFKKYNYLCDTHTAVAICCADKYISETGDDRIIITDSTASPYKFAKDVYTALCGKNTEKLDDLDALDKLREFTGVDIPYPLAGIAERKVRFTGSVEKTEMKQVVIDCIR